MPAVLFLVKYWREVAIALLALIAIGIGIYIRSVFAERDQLKQEKAVLTAQLKSAAALAEMNNKIAEAISQIKIRSSVNVSRIESAPKPVFVDTRPIPFIPAGLPQRLYSSAAAADRITAGAAPGGALPPGEPTSRVLPH